MSTIIKGNVTFNFDSNVDAGFLNKVESILNTLANSSYNDDFFGEALVVNVHSGSGGSITFPSTGAGNPAEMYLDPSDWDNDYFINLGGTKTAYTDTHVFVHELIHAVSSKKDILDSSGGDADTLEDFEQLLADPNGDLMGATVRYANQILSGLFGDHPRGHYAEYYSPSNQALYSDTAWSLFSLADYTGGGSVDAVVMTPPLGPVDWEVHGRTVNGVAQRDLILAFDGNQTIYAGGGDDYIYAGAGSDIVAGNTAVDHINGNSGADILTGGDLAGDFSAASLQSSGYFKFYHSEWNDGSRDILNGGEDADDILTAGFMAAGPLVDYSTLDFISESTIADAMKTLDFISATDTDFTLHSQMFEDNWTSYAELKADQLQAAKSALNVSGAQAVYLGHSDRYNSDGELGMTNSVYGAKVYHATYGSLMVVFTSLNAYNSRILGFVQDLLSSRDPNSNEPWTIFGNGSTGNGGSGNIAEAAALASSATDNDIIAIGNGGDTVYALSGDDTIIAAQYGAGDDAIDGGDGIDTVDYSAATSAITVTFDSIELTISGSSIGTDGAYDVENIVGGSGNDIIAGTGSANVLTGNAGTDKLKGGDGDDTHSGGAGLDTLIGGLGNDVYIIAASGDNTDVVTEDASAGTDTIQAAISFSIASIANVENITLTGTSAINATGNALANALTGNAAINTLTGGDGNDTLDGGAGNDTLIGGLGSDKYYVDSGSDIVTEATGAGTDIVYATASFTLSANVEKLTLQEGAAVSATGNTLANVLTGNSSANTLDGGAAGDTMSGGAGHDTYVS